MFDRSNRDIDLLQCMQEDMHGMHLCSIYRNKEEQLAVAVPFIALGLKRGERCVYVFEETTQQEICRELDERNMHPGTYIKSGQLVFLSKAQSYLRDGYFSLARMIELFQNIHYETLSSGFSGLRGTGEAAWYLDNAPGSNRLIEYESHVNHTLKGFKFAALCQYNENTMPENILVDMIYTHPKIVFYGVLYNNPFYIPPDKFLVEMNKEHRIRDYQKLKEQIINIL